MTTATKIAASGAPVPIVLPYQRRWIADDSALKLGEKSRRIGLTFAECIDVVSSRMDGSRRLDYWYSSADESAAREFAEEAARLVRGLGQAVEIITDVQIVDAKDCKVFRIDFPTGARANRPKLVSMSSNPKTFRSKGGDVGLDEFAFHESPDEMYKAAQPVTTWGGRLRVLSSHRGHRSKFNGFCDMARRKADAATHGEPRPG